MSDIDIDVLRMQMALSDGNADVAMVDMQAATAAKLETQFDHERFFSCLPKHTQLGEVLLCARQLSSTQTLLQENNAVIPDNSVCTAYQQVGGKGTAVLAVLFCS